MAAIILGILAIFATLYLARALGLVKQSHQHCEGCGQERPVTKVRYFKNTGMVIMFQVEEAGATLCRSCSAQLFLRMQTWTMALGWWGFISFFVNIFFVLNNFAMFFWSLTLPNAKRATKKMVSRALEEQREYATLMLATKDFDVVADVLSRNSNAPRDEVEKWLRELQGC